MTATDDPEAYERHSSLSGQPDNGSFLVPFRQDDFKMMRAEYLPVPGFAPCAVGWTERR